MTRWWLHPLALAALFCCLCALPALGQSAIDLSDNFDDGVLDASKWAPASWPEGTSGSIEERDGMLVLTRGAEDASGHQVWSTWALRGAFDVQVDYQLLDWPQARYLGVSLMARTSDSYSSVTRYQNTGSEAYAAGYLGPPQCLCGGNIPATDMGGTLRLTRDADDTLTAYFWSAETASWTAFSSATVPGDARVSLDFNTTADLPASVAFDNFRVNSGELVPTPVLSDNFDDGVIDTTQWQAYAEPGASIEENGGQIIMSLPPSDWGEINLTSTWRLHGSFDIQADYQLLQWPASNGGRVGLLAMFPNDWEWEWVQRTSGVNPLPESDELYLANVRSDHGCPCEGRTATSDMAGRLRLTRDADLNLTFYYWSNDTSEWVPIYQRAVPADDMQIRLTCWGPVTAPEGVVAAFDNFQVNSGEVVSAAPSIEDVQIDRGRDTDWWDSPMWHERYTVQVKGTAYEQPNCILIQDPQGDCMHLPTCGAGGCWSSPNPGGSWEDAQVIAGPDYTYTYVWHEARKEHPIPEGSYQITVFGNAGSQTTLTTAAVPALPEAGPVLFAPAADGVVDTTVPTFEWLPLSGTEAILQVREEGNTTYTTPGPVQDDCGEIWRASVDGQLAAVYNFDGTGPDLDPGRTYFWQLSDRTPVDDRVSDPRVAIWNDQTARHRFTVNTTWPALPDLPGRLIYEQTMYGGVSDPYNAETILQYGTTPAARKWVGPDASHTPSYSWDGTKIAYHLSDWGTYVANADGSDPVRLPVTYGWSGPDFSPDATWLTFADGESQGGVPQHIYIQKPFASERTLLVRARGRRTRGPHWSPDGRWIAYASCCDPSGNNIWLVHPDGTQDHPVVPTTLAGYPGWTITWLGSTVVWSPDATRLGVNFSAESADGSSYLDGVGTISLDGGELTPVFTNPPGYVCCATANALCWSPDGGSLVFSSAHHLSVNPDWANGLLETGVELWMRNADGTGEPIRLTYDYSHDVSAAWWAPNTAVRKEASIVRGDATVTFAQVTAEGSTRMNVTFDVPGPAPTGYSFASEIWSGATTAGYQGDLTVALKYEASLAGREDALALMEWNAEKGKWQNITAHPIDVVNRVIRGQTKSLGLFAICLKSG